MATQPKTPRRRDTRLNQSSNWIGGAMLVGLGVLLLLRNLTDFHLDNWWALFILIPAAGAFDRAWRSYREAGGHWTTLAQRSLFGGVILTGIAAIFLFGLSWNILGPALLVLLGASLLFTSLFAR